MGRSAYHARMEIERGAGETHQYGRSEPGHNYSTSSPHKPEQFHGFLHALIMLQTGQITSFIKYFQCSIHVVPEKYGEDQLDRSREK